MLRLFAPILVLMFQSTHLTIALANDSIASLATQGLVLEKTDQVAMKKERLRISPSKIEVEYEFLNESDVDLETTVAFPLPDSDCWTEQPSSIRVSNFSVKVDGKILKPNFELRAWLDNKDITDRLKGLGLSKIECSSLSEAKAAVKKDLKEAGLSEYSDMNGEDTPKWSLRSKYFWKARFPARKSVFVSHSYTPQLGGNSIGEVYLLYGNSSDELMVWANEHLEHHSGSNGDYILKTGNHWKNGIESLDLTVEGSELVWTYLDGRLYSGVGRLHFKREMFKPTTDLSFAFLNLGVPLPEAFFDTKTIDGPANLRESPGGEILGSIPNKSTVQVIDYKPKWFKIKFEKKVGWTNESNIVVTEAETPKQGKLKACIVALEVTFPGGKTRKVGDTGKKLDEKDCLALGEYSKKTQTDFNHSTVHWIKVTFDGREILKQNFPGP